MSPRVLDGWIRGGPPVRAVAVLAAVTVSLAACAASDEVTVEGIVTGVDGDLTAVASFEVLTVDGDTIELVPAPFGDFDFPLPHLISHMNTLEPVEVTYSTAEDGVRLASAIGDAPEESEP